MTLVDLSDLATIVGVIVATLVGVKAILEYARQSVQKRAEFFFKLAERLSENDKYVEILHMLESDDPQLSTIDLGERRELMGLLEEVAILLNSGLVKDSVALHFFGYYAIDCWESKHMWEGLNREEHWKVLGDFVNRMKRVEKRPFKRENFRF